VLALERAFCAPARAPQLLARLPARQDPGSGSAPANDLGRHHFVVIVRPRRGRPAGRTKGEPCVLFCPFGSAARLPPPARLDGCGLRANKPLELGSRPAGGLTSGVRQSIIAPARAGRPADRVCVCVADKDLSGGPMQAHRPVASERPNGPAHRRRRLILWVNQGKKSARML
jgi:hypothetical protein